MAVSVKRNTLTDAMVGTIRTMLTLQPSSSNYYHPSQSFHSTQLAKNKPVTFYLFDKCENPDESFVHLPYLFASALLQIRPNSHIEYPLCEIHFTGSLRGPTPEKPQQIDQSLVCKEAMEHLSKYGTTTIGLPPASGKTVIGAYLASKISLLVCVLCHREVILKQWKKTFSDFTTANCWIVGENDPPSIIQVIVCLDERVHIIPKDLRDKVGYLIIDEAHAFFTTKHVEGLLSFHPKYITLESATLERTDGMHTMAYALVGKHGIFIKQYKPFIVTKLNTLIKATRQSNKYGPGVDWTVLKQSLLYHDIRNKLIVEIILANKAFKIMVLTNEKEHVDILYKIIKERTIGTGYTVDYMRGNKGSYLDSNVLVGTIHKMGTGFDEATACQDYKGRPTDLVIIVCSIKEPLLLEQVVGRGFRADRPNIIHFVDDDPTIIKHWSLNQKWYLASNGIIREETVQYN